MVQRRLITIGIALLVAGAFALGLLVQRQIQLARIRAGENFARDLAGLNRPVPPAPPGKDWYYPGAKVSGTAESAAVTVSRELVHPGGHFVVLVTSDDFETVAKYYTSRMQFTDPDAIAKSQLAFSSEGNVQGESSHVLDDFRDPSETQTQRSIRTKCLLRRSPSYNLTVFLSRAENEPQTHIILLYDPKATAEIPK